MFRFKEWGKLSWMVRLSCLISGGVLAGLAILLTVDALNRRLLNRPWIGTWDVASTSFVVITFLAIAYGFSQGREIRIDLLTSRFKGKGSYIFQMIASISSAVFFGILAWEGWLLWQHAFSVGEVRVGYPVPMVIPLGGLLLGACLVVAVSIVSFIKNIQVLFPTSNRLESKKRVGKEQD